VAVLKGKAVAKLGTRKAINMENLELTQDCRSMQREKQVSGLLSVPSAPQ